MKKMLLSAALVIAAMSANAQNVFTMDGETFMTAQGAADPTVATDVAAGTLIVDNDDFTLSIGGADQYKASGAGANGYEQISFGGTVMDFSSLSGITGSNNPKGAAGEDPASTFVAPATGTYYTLKAKKDGIVYVAQKASSNKAYTVFEEGECLSYEFAMQLNAGQDPNDNPCEGVLSYTLPANEMGYYEQSNGKILWPIQYYHSDMDPAVVASAGNGVGVIKFNVYADCNYIFNAVGSKMTLAGVCFSEKPVDVILVNGEAEDGSALPNVTLFTSGDPTGITEVVADKADNANAPAYNIAGQRVSKNAKGLVIINGKKYINK